MSTAESTCLESGVSPPTKKSKLSATAGESPIATPPGAFCNSGTSDSNQLNNNMEVNGGNGLHEDQQNGSGRIDEGLYSRQLYVLGKEAMAKMAKSNILVSGLGGLGVEIAKNICLGGVKSVTLHDTKKTSWSDLSTQFYLKKADIGQNRAEISLQQLSELNPYVRVDVITEPLTEALVGNKYQVVVIADRTGTVAELLQFSKFCHDNKIYFILAETRGVFSRLFCDFGEGFVVHDINGEQPVTAMIAAISNETSGVVSCLDETRHGLEDGDFVKFSEIVGMEGLNDAEPIKITVTGTDTFTIGDTTGFGQYENGGVVTQVKMPRQVDFKSLEESLQDPETIITDFAKMEHPQQLHLGFRALDKFIEEFNSLPRPWNKDDAEKLVSIANIINADDTGKSKVEKIDEKLLHLFSFVSAGNICPMNGFLGGVAAQEVMKACSGKFHPIKQWLYFDAVECLPQFNAEESLPSVDEADFSPSNSRYDGNIAVFGKIFHEKLANLKYFVVGAGAIGCELLKNFAMMGMATGDKGKLIVTDMDLIERSNLNRQFLFRSSDVGTAKSEAAARAIQVMNPSVNIEPQKNFVGPKTESIYTDEFFEQLDGVANALDNVEARIYMDRRCVYYRKPLLESGTLGTKGNTQVVLPYKTESYGSSQDPPERSIPMCTLRNFPNAIEHTLQWARDLFEGVFSDAAKSAAEYLNDTNFIQSTLRKPGAQPVQDLEAVKKCLVDERPHNIEDCVKWARFLWEDNFNNQIQQLLYNFPADQKTTSGQYFWSGPKRCPTTFEFGKEDNPFSIDFVYTAANLRAEMYGIPQLRDRSRIAELAMSVVVPLFEPKSGVRIAVTDAEALAMDGSSDKSEVEELLQSIPSVSSLQGVVITPLEFEKDVDENLHIDFIAAASNSRAANYKIQPADRFRTKLIAGRIIPAIATTTSVVAGLVALELYKVAMNCTNLDRYKNGFINLALPFFAFSEPIEAPKKKYYDTEWTLWDRFEVTGEKTLQEFMNYFRDEHDLHITMLSQGVCMLYSFFMAADKRQERMNLPLCEVVRRVSKFPQAPHVRALVFELCCNDKANEDVEVPYVRYVIPDSQLRQEEPMNH